MFYYKIYANIQTLIQIIIIEPISYDLFIIERIFFFIILFTHYRTYSILLFHLLIIEFI